MRFDATSINGANFEMEADGTVGSLRLLAALVADGGANLRLCRDASAGGEERDAAWSVRLPPPHQYDKWPTLKGHCFARLESRG